MPTLALILAVIWFLVVFVLRTVIQWSRTGSTGFEGFRGKPGSLPWLAGTMVSCGFAVTLAAPVVAFFDWPGGAMLVYLRPVHLIGAVILGLGTVGTFVAQNAMGDSWRVGVGEDEETQLVTSGLFSWVRNPIFSFMGLSYLGLILLLPTAATLLGASLATVGIVLQVRIVEEPYLVRTHGAEYRAYAARVGRFLPGVGRI